MQADIQFFNLDREFWTDERCYITELLNTGDDPEVSIARARVLPGVTTRWHRLRGITERYVILEGKGRMEVGNLEPQDVGTGAVILIPSDIRQRITNIGNQDLIFLAICTPRFCQEAYEDIDIGPQNDPYD